MQNIIIRTPKKEDIPTLLQWGTSAPELWSSDDSTWHSKEELSKWINNPGNDVLLVADVDKQIAGMCLTYSMRDWAYCSSLYVDKQFRKLGLGTMLVEEAQRRMQAKRIYYFGLLINVKNIESKKFYEKIGFQKGFNFTWMYRRSRKT